jgi:hypothetical protein
MEDGCKLEHTVLRYWYINFEVQSQINIKVTSQYFMCQIAKCSFFIYENII